MLDRVCMDKIGDMNFLLGSSMDPLELFDSHRSHWTHIVGIVSIRYHPMQTNSKTIGETNFGSHLHYSLESNGISLDEF